MWLRSYYVYADLLTFLNKCMELREIEESQLEASTSSSNLIESTAVDQNSSITPPIAPRKNFDKKKTDWSSNWRKYFKAPRDSNRKVAKSEIHECWGWRFVILQIYHSYSKETKWCTEVSIQNPGDELPTNDVDTASPSVLSSSNSSTTFLQPSNLLIILSADYSTLSNSSPFPF